MTKTEIILSNVKKLYDGASIEATSIHEGCDLHLVDGKIKQLRPHDPAARTSDDVRVIDASSWYVTPGLIDCHGHVTVHGLSQEDLEASESAAGYVYVEKILWRTLVDGGVTTLRDVGGATHMMKRLVDEGVFIGPRMKIAICMLSTTGGHADFLGPDRCHGELQKFWGPAPGRPSSVVDGPWECRKRVREIVACGADLIKLCTSPGVASPSDHLENQDFSAEEIEAICTEAAARGVKVAAHAHSQSGIGLAIEHGVHDIQHVSWMDDRLVERAYEKGCTVTPTSWTMAVLQTTPDLSDFVRDKAKRAYDVHAQAVQHARAGGLKILMGTDGVWPGMHGRNWMELVHLIREGLTALEAWYASTGAPASEIGQPDTGVLKEGMRADLLVCTEDVIDDPARFDQGALLEVVKDGVAYRGGVDGLPQRTFRDSVHDAIGPVLED